MDGGKQLSINGHQQMSLFGDSYENSNEPEFDLLDSSWPKHQTREFFPNTLIVDFSHFVNYLAQQPIQLTKKKEYIPAKHLTEINKRLTIKANDVTKHSQQEYYPYIHFFYHMALAARLIKKESTDSNITYVKLTKRWNKFNQLTNTEKYIFLLETFWIDMDWALTSDVHYNPIHLMIEDVFSKLLNKNSSLQLNNKYSLLYRYTRYWNHFFLYLEWLGIWVCESDIEEIKRSHKKNYYYAKSITLTSFGEKVIPILLKERPPQLWNIPFRRETGEVNPIPGTELDTTEHCLDQTNDLKQQEPTSFYKAFVKIFPKGSLQKTLPRRNCQFIPGLYTFKITDSNKSWREVTLTSKDTMEDLHQFILQSFGFDDDHLYSFFMDGKKWSKVSIVSPFDHSGDPIASQVTIGSVGLYAGQRFMYLYDYGDEWIFIITVEHITEHNES